MILNVCANPDLLRIMQIVNGFVTVAKILLPLIIIGMATLDVTKVLLEGKQEELKKASEKAIRRVVAAIIIFFIPTIVGTVFGFLKNNVDFMSCITDATEENVKLAYIRRAELSVYWAEQSLELQDYNTAYTHVSSLQDGEEKENYKARLLAIKNTLDDKKKYTPITPPSSNETAPSGIGGLEISGSYYSSGRGVAQAGVKLKNEPDPSAAINYWSNYLDATNFIYPKDEETGKSLGAWPKNYESIPTQLSNYKTYQNGIFIFPTTPTNGNYHFVYDHHGIDIMAPVGTPIYSPVDGTLGYSTWGKTANTGGDETAYSVTIYMDSPIDYGGITVGQVFLTHMCGIIYRCGGKDEISCTRKIKKGELIGFVGNASGSAESIGYAPHLHMTFHTLYKYEPNLMTGPMESIYEIPNGTSSYDIKAGG